MSAANKTYRESEKALQKMTLRQQQQQQRRHDASSTTQISRPKAISMTFVQKESAARENDLQVDHGEIVHCTHQDTRRSLLCLPRQKKKEKKRKFQCHGGGCDR